MKRYLLSSIISGLLGSIILAGLAWAALTTSGIQILSPTGGEIVAVVPSGGPASAGLSQYLLLTQARDSQGYSKQVPVSGGTITIPNNISRLIINPAGTLSTLTILTPLVPQDGQEVCIWSTQIVTTLTMTASPGQTLNGALTALVANGAQIAGTASCWAYSLSNTTWDRSG